MNDTEQLTVLMTRAVADLEVPEQRLRSEAMETGRRLRRRRRAAAGVGAVAAATTLFLTLSPAVGGGSQAGQRYAEDPQPPSPAYSETANPPSTSSTLNAHPEPGPGFWDMPAAELLARLKPLLPAGVQVSHAQLTLTDTAPGESHRAKGWLRVTLARDGVAGQGDLELMLWSPGRGSAVVECPGNLQPGPGVDCTPLNDPAGRRVDTSVGALEMHEVTVRAGQGYVYVATANSTDDKWGEGSSTSAAAPLLSLDEVQAIATADVWTDWQPPAS